jgi:hypothetical protein
MTAGTQRVEFEIAPGTPAGIYLAMLTIDYGITPNVRMFAK